jgi:hypothetical protein
VLRHTTTTSLPHSWSTLSKRTIIFCQKSPPPHLVSSHRLSQIQLGEGRIWPWGCRICAPAWPLTPWSTGHSALLRRPREDAENQKGAPPLLSKGLAWVPGRPLSYGHPRVHYSGGYQDRLLSGPLGLLDLGYRAPAGVERKDYRGLVLC